MGIFPLKLEIPIPCHGNPNSMQRGQWTSFMYGGFHRNINTANGNHLTVAWDRHLDCRVAGQSNNQMIKDPPLTSLSLSSPPPGIVQHGHHLNTAH